MKKKCKVVMLPTEKASNLVISKIDNKVIYTNNKIKLDSTFNPQYLYIISDDKIKDGDNNWCIYDNQLILNDIYCQATLKDCKKIIATTDKSLGFIGKFNNEDDYILPQIPESFIKIYNNNIKEVLVDYEKILSDESLGEEQYLEERIKINFDNIINISIENKTYTKKEVEKLLRCCVADITSGRNNSVQEFIK